MKSKQKPAKLGAHNDHQQGAEMVDTAAGVIDPVCGMTVDPKTTKHKADHKGHTYYFCSAGCKTKFVAPSAKYL